ncbi:MAG TPA: hypothetical protein PLB05_02080 [Candidatus Omnitrophota bacterium]|nr:hypothetical protein [Candidatus Omnitrophota bacterium]
MNNQRISKIYDYQDTGGNLLFQVVRFEPKSFAQRRPVNGNFVWGLGEVKPVLYRLQEVTQAIQDGKTIYVCEGEKDADNLRALGLVATSCPMGAGKWQAAYTKALNGCYEAVVLADKDEPGRAHAFDVAGDLCSAGIPVKVVEMPDMEGTKIKDVSEWLSAGGTHEELLALVDKLPHWELSQVADPVINPELQSLISRYGEPYYLSKDGGVTALNQAFWASLHQAEHIQLYEPDERVFYRYDAATGLYSVISEDVIKQEIASRILEVSRDLGLPSLERKRTNSSLNHIVAHLKGISEKKNAFKRIKTIVHLANGVIVFKDNGEADFCSFSPEFYSRNQCPIPFDPEAKCERFLNELLYPAVTPDDAVLLQKYAGLSLLGNNLIQKFLILDGEPGRGKSTLVLVIRALVGQNNTTELRTKHLNERFELFRYLKRTLLTSVDVPGNFLSEKGAHVIKGLVGGDWFDAEQKCGTGSFPFQGNFCMLITSNSRLQVRLDGDTGAWRRRLLIIRFNAPEPAKVVPEFNEVLIRDEGSGILNWALQGLGMLLQDIKERGTIALTEAQKNIVDALLAESDSLRQFLVENVVTDEESDLTVTEIIEAYAEYCPLKGWNPKPITVIQRELERLVLELFKTTKSNSITREDEGNGKEKSQRGFRRVNFRQEEKRTWD